MEAIEVIKLIELGEDSHTQFKQTITNPASLAGDLVAFSNSKGGKIIIGVNDQGVVMGLSSEEVRRINQLISNTATNLVRPSVNIESENINVGEKLVIIVKIPEGISKPYSDNSGVFWVKAGADKRRVTSREEVQRIFQSVAIIHADEIPIDGTTTEDIDLEHFGNFFEKQYGESVEKVLEREKISMCRLMNNLGLARGTVLNLAGLMIFGKNPQRYRPAFVVKAISFVGNDPAGEKYRDSQDITGCLRILHKEIMSFLSRNLRRLQGERGINTEGELEVPMVAMEELVANMLLHRDYFISAPWRIMLFDNRIELISPGALPNNLTIENIRCGVSVIRNPLIASYATKEEELPYRGIGTGIIRALAAIPTIKLESDTERNLFTASIPREG